MVLNKGHGDCGVFFTMWLQGHTKELNGCVVMLHATSRRNSSSAAYKKLLYDVEIECVRYILIG